MLLPEIGLMLTIIFKVLFELSQVIYVKKQQQKSN